MSIHTREGMGFVRVDCLVADAIRYGKQYGPGSTLTDLSGQFGEPVVFTEWGFEDEGGIWRVVMREIRWPADPGRGCEHWVPAPGFDYDEWGEQS